MDAIGAIRRRLQNGHPIWARLFRNFSISLSGSLLLLLIGVARVPLLTKNLPLADYGRILIVLNFFYLFNSVFKIRVLDLLFRFLPHFEKDKDAPAAAALFQLSLLLCGCMALVLAGIVFFAGEWICARLYGDTSLWPLMRVYLAAGMAMTFSDFSIGILRMRDRFTSVVAPQVIGNASALVLVLIYMLISGGRSLTVIMGLFALGHGVSAIGPLLLSLRLLPGGALTQRVSLSCSALRPHRARIISTLWHTNLVSYLKLGEDETGVFLLGVFSTPEQVAFYGLARTLMRPLTLLQNNLQSALNPEVVQLYAKRQFSRLENVIRRVMSHTALFGGVVLLAAIPFARPLILLLTTREYLGAVPVFNVVLLTTYVTLVGCSFYSLTLAMDRLMRRNIITALRFVYLIAAIFMGLNAFVLAGIQFVGIFSVRLFNDLPLYREIRHLAAEDSPVQKEGTPAHE